MNCTDAYQYPAIGTHLTMQRDLCPVGEHDYEVVVEDSMTALMGYKNRLVLYCRRCGDIIVHSLEIEPNDS